EKPERPIPATSRRLRRRGLHPFEQVLRRQIRPIGPLDRPRIRIDCGAPKHVEVQQRLEHLSPKLSAKVNLALGAIVEPEPEHVVMQMANFDDVEHLLLQGRDGHQRSTATGAIPVFEKLCFVLRSPLEYESARPGWELTGHSTVQNPYGNLMIAVARVEVLRFVV